MFHSCNMTRFWLALMACSLLGFVRTASGSCSVALVQESIEAAQPNGGQILFALSGCSISAISASILQLPAISFTAQGSSSIQALVTASGLYSVSVSQSGLAVSGSPFSVAITAGALWRKIPRSMDRAQPRLLLANPTRFLSSPRTRSETTFPCHRCLL